MLLAAQTVAGPGVCHPGLRVRKGDIPETTGLFFGETFVFLKMLFERKNNNWQ